MGPHRPGRKQNRQRHEADYDYNIPADANGGEGPYETKSKSWTKGHEDGAHAQPRAACMRWEKKLVL